MERKSSDEVREQRCDWAAKTLLIFTVRLAFVFVLAFWFAFAGKLFLIYYSSTNAEKRPSAKKKLKKKKIKNTGVHRQEKAPHATRSLRKTVFGSRGAASTAPPLHCSNVPKRRVRLSRSVVDPSICCCLGFVLIHLRPLVLQVLLLLHVLLLLLLLLARIRRLVENRELVLARIFGTWLRELHLARADCAM